LQQVEARRAEVKSIDRPILEPSDAKGAAVADPLTEDAPGVAKVAAVLPDRAQRLREVVRLLKAEPVRAPADEE